MKGKKSDPLTYFDNQPIINLEKLRATVYPRKGMRFRNKQLILNEYEFKHFPHFQFYHS